VKKRAVSKMAVIIKWLAHASFQITTKERIIYVDLEKYGQFTDKADLILVTHIHTDHCDPDQIKKARKLETVVIAPSDCASKIGGNVKTLKPGEETKVGDIHIKAFEAYGVKRFRSPGVPFHPRGLGVGYLITAEGKTIYHAGDTDFIPEMRQLTNVDVALLPSGDTYTMDNNDAAEAALEFKPHAVIPMHRWSTNPEELKKNIEAKSDIKVVILKEGQEYQVP
jgi:L-ascorbate metabolism protein UlaG (beta-lactamase superfamily)